MAAPQEGARVAALLLLLVLACCALAPRELFTGALPDDRSPVSQKMYDWLKLRGMRNLDVEVRVVPDPDDEPLPAWERPPECVSLSGAPETACSRRGSP